VSSPLSPERIERARADAQIDVDYYGDDPEFAEVGRLLVAQTLIALIAALREPVALSAEDKAAISSAIVNSRWQDDPITLGDNHQGGECVESFDVDRANALLAPIGFAIVRVFK
jgi:hypothetical protein